MNVKWSDGSEENLTDWSTDYLYVGTGTERKRCRVLYANSEKGGEQIGLLFKKDGAYTDVVKPDKYGILQAGETFTVIPFIYNDPENAETYASDGKTFTYQLQEPVILNLDQETTVSSPRNDDGWASFTADEEGSYVANGTYTYGYGSNTTNFYVYRKDSASGQYRYYSSSQKPTVQLSAGESILYRFDNSSNSVRRDIVTVSRKYPLTSIALSDGEGSIFDLNKYSGGSSLPEMFQMNFVYGEGETQTTETATLRSGYTSYEDDVMYYCAYGPYDENVYLYFLDKDGNIVNGPAVQGNVLPEAGSYPVRAVIKDPDPTIDGEDSLTQDAVLVLTEPEFKELSLKKSKAFAADYRKQDYFQYTAEEDGTYTFSLDGSNASQLRLNQYTFEDGKYTYVRSDWLYSYSNNSVSIEMENGKTYYITLENPYNSDTAKGGLKLTKIKNIDSVRISVDTDRIFAHKTLEGNPDFLTVSYTDTDGKNGAIRDWNTAYAQIDGSSYCVLSGKGSNTETIGIAFKYGDAWVNYSFESGFYGDAEYTLQAFRMNHSDEINTFASQNPGAAVEFKLSEAAAALLQWMNRWLSSLKGRRKTDGMPSLRLKMGGYFLDAGQYSNANLRVYRKSAPEDENADDRIWYTYVNDFWNRGSVTLKKGMN